LDAPVNIPSRPANHRRRGQVHDFHSRQEIDRHPLKRSESFEALLTIHL
jgi:hypothetical protein